MLSLIVWFVAWLLINNIASMVVHCYAIGNNWKVPNWLPFSCVSMFVSDLKLYVWHNEWSNTSTKNYNVKVPDFHIYVLIRKPKVWQWNYNVHWRKRGYKNLYTTENDNEHVQSKAKKMRTLHKQNDIQ